MMQNYVPEGAHFTLRSRAISRSTVDCCGNTVSVKVYPLGFELKSGEQFESDERLHHLSLIVDEINTKLRENILAKLSKDAEAKALYLKWIQPSAEEKSEAKS